ncbi:hypothetical protein Q3H58_003268 [Pseudomonas psychrotolerans]|nr:hypothetical protein [Pseudomonas psychrotolerans]
MDMRTEPARKVRLTTANVLLAELLKPFLEERHGIELCCVSELAGVGDASLVLIDLGSVPEAELERWLEGLVPAVTVAFLNATVEQALPWVERFPAIQGVFAPQASREQLLQGLGALLAGEDWLPRGILAHLLPPLSRTAQHRRRWPDPPRTGDPAPGRPRSVQRCHRPGTVPEHPYRQEPYA